jgi:hypothetical protein
MIILLSSKLFTIIIHSAVIMRIIALLTMMQGMAMVAMVLY